MLTIDGGKTFELSVRPAVVPEERRGDWHVVQEAARAFGDLKGVRIGLGLMTNRRDSVDNDRASTVCYRNCRVSFDKQGVEEKSEREALAADPGLNAAGVIGPTKDLQQDEVSVWEANGFEHHLSSLRLGCYICWRK